MAGVNGRVVAAGVAAVLAIAAPIVAKWEGVRYAVYLDPIGIPTVCYGHVEPGLKVGQSYTKAECDELLQQDMAEADAIVRRCIPVPMLRHVEAALVSATFNIGPSVVCGSTLQRKAMANDWPGACAELSRWDKAAGRQMRGLTLRRADERKTCEGP